MKCPIARVGMTRGVKSLSSLKVAEPPNKKQLVDVRRKASLPGEQS